MKNILVAGIICFVLIHAACGDADTPTRVTMINGSPELEAIALRQFNDLHTIVARHYPGKRFDKHYTVRIVPHDDECEEPISFLLPPQRVPVGTNYDGSPGIDKDHAVNGYVSLCAGGQWLPNDDVILVTELGLRTQPVARFEGEHRVLFAIDKYRYEATKIHTVGNPHPILF